MIVQYKKFITLLICCIFTIPGYSRSISSSQPEFEDWKIQKKIQANQIFENSELWQLISEPGTTPVIYYEPLSVKTVKPGFASVTSLINYTSDEGNAESLLGITVYDCAMGTKQEQSTVQYSQHWADGDVVLQIGLEDPWQPVKLGTEGMRLLKVACDLR